MDDEGYEGYRWAEPRQRPLPGPHHWVAERLLTPCVGSSCGETCRPSTLLFSEQREIGL